MNNNKKIFILIVTTVVCILLIYSFKDVVWEVRITLSLIIASIILWIFEPLPFSQISIALMVLLIIFQVADTEVILSGFSSYALFLFLGGMMVAKGVNNTDLGKRLSLWILHKLAYRNGGLLLGIIIIQQILSVFVPAPMIRTALILPVLEPILNKLKHEVQFKKQLVMGVAYGGNISTVGFLPSAIVNLITIEFLNTYTDVHISYLDWFLIMFPLWILVIPLTWIVLLKTFPAEHISIEDIYSTLIEARNELGSFDKNEIKALFIIIFIISMWFTQPLHHIHPAISALVGSILLSSPVIGVIHWKNIIKINFDVILISGATLSIGYALNESGTALYISSLVNHPVVQHIFANESLSVLLIIVFVHLYHMVVSNVGTAIVTLLPIVMSFSLMVGLDPVKIALITNITLTFGFILVVETFPNILAHDTKIVSQKDFVYPGILTTILTALATFLVVSTWWNLFL